MSQTRYLKNMITPTLVEPTENHEAGVASGVWSTQDQLEARRGDVWPEAGVTDPSSLIENNFSTFLYTGDGSTRNIENGINLSGKGGLVWIKDRDVAKWHKLFDTERGVNNALYSNETDAQTSASSTLTAFNSNGFTLGAGGAGNGNSVNEDTKPYSAWTFKKAPKFFDIVTYTGNATHREISHNLSSEPGMIWIKRTDDAESWICYHRSLDQGGGSGATEFMSGIELESNGGQYGATLRWSASGAGEDHTATTFHVSDHAAINGNGYTYVAYLLAHETGSDSMIQCGVGVISGGSATVNLGWEPQWVLYKNASANGNWTIIDDMRGWTADGAISALYPNTSGAESAGTGYEKLTSTGFVLQNYTNGHNYIYVAIRRPNMATITDATKVYKAVQGAGGDALADIGFPTDFLIFKSAVTGSAENVEIATRLQGRKISLRSHASDAESVDNGGKWSFDRQNSFSQQISNGSSNIMHNFKRAKGYFDVVTYAGTGSAKTEAHSLGVVPEMMWVKVRNESQRWNVYFKGGSMDATDYLILNATNAPQDSDTRWNDTDPTSSVFTVGSSAETNTSGDTYIAYLFASLAGVSKIGTVVHSGSSTDVDCGFSAGARFVMLKDISAAGDWYVWDSVRGIIAGNDPVFSLNNRDAEQTDKDWIDPLASGFNINGAGDYLADGTYLFWAVA